MAHPNAKRTGAPMPPEHAPHLLSPIRGLVLSPGALVRRLQLEPDSTVLELGPGPGYFSPAVARAVPGGRLVLADVQQEMLDMARDRLEKLGLENVEYCLAPGDSLPLEDESVDVAFLSAVLGEVPDRASCLAEPAPCPANEWPPLDHGVQGRGPRLHPTARAADQCRVGGVRSLLPPRTPAPLHAGLPEDGSGRGQFVTSRTSSRLRRRGRATRPFEEGDTPRSSSPTCSARPPSQIARTRASSSPIPTATCWYLARSRELDPARAAGSWPIVFEKK